MLRKGPSPKMSKQPKHLESPGQLGFLQEPGLLPVGCNIHTNFSAALQGSHSQGSKGQWCDSSIICGTCDPPPQASLGTGGSWVTHGASAFCGTWHDPTILRRDRCWEEVLGWGTSGWKCSGVGAEGGPNRCKTGLSGVSRTAALYILRGPLRDAWLWVLYPSAHGSSPTGLREGSHMPLQPHRYPP